MTAPLRVESAWLHSNRTANNQHVLMEHANAFTTSSTLAQWRSAMVASGLARRTVADRIRTLTRFESDMQVPILAANHLQIADWIGARPDIGAATRAAYHSMMSAFFKWANLIDLRNDNPMDKVKAARRPKRSPRPVSNPGFHRMLDLSPDDTMTAMLVLAGYQGFRVHEVAKMHGNLLDYEAKTITVRGKNDTESVLPAHVEVLKIAERMPRGYWFPSQRARHLGGRCISERVKLHMIRSRVPGTPHCLRHFFATELVEKGVDLRVVQELMRHSQLSTTAAYVATTDSRKRAAIDLLQ